MRVNKARSFRPAALVSNITLFALLFTFYCVITAFLVLHVRRWDPVIVHQALGLLAYPLFFFGIVSAGLVRWPKNVWVSPVSALIFVFLPTVLVHLGAWSLIPIGLAGILLTGRSFWNNKENRSIFLIIQLFIAAAILSVFFFFLLNACDPSIFTDVSILKGTTDRDTLLFLSIINMLARFGIPSSGLDGVVPILHYHVGSYHWVAHNLNILGGQTSLLYALARQIAFVPAVFFMSLITMALVSVNTQGWKIPLLFATSFLWLLHQQTETIFVGNAFTLALLFLIAMAPAGKDWLERMEQNQTFTCIQWWEIIIAIIAVCQCWHAKLPVGLILAYFLVLCVFIPKFLRNPKSFIIPLVIIAIIAIKGFFVFTHYAVANGFIFPITPFDFIRDYQDDFWRTCLTFQIFMLLQCFISKSEPDTRKNLAIVFISTFVVAILPGFIIAITGESIVLFTQSCLFLVAVFVVPDMIDAWYSLLAQRKLHAYALTGVTSIMLLLTFLDSDYTNGITGIFYNLPDMLKAWSSPILPGQGFTWTGGQSGGRIHQLLNVILSPPRIDKDELKSTTITGSMQRVIDSYKISKNDKSIAVYVPPTLLPFWMDYDGHIKECWFQSFLIPALTGLPLLNGVRAGLTINGTTVCKYTTTELTGIYGPDSRNYLLSPQELCTRAKQKGFRKVLIIDTEKTEMTSCTLP